MKYAYVILAASVGVLAACSRLSEFDFDKNTNPDEGELVERIVFEVPALRSLGEDGETRASLSQEEDNPIRFGWEKSDTVGIYPNQGAQVSFKMDGEEGSNVASFNGGGWALRQEATYSCYYPFVGSIYLDRNAIPVSFDNQVFALAQQVQDEMPSYKGIRFILASESTSSSSGSLRFTFNILNTVIRVKAAGLPAGTYTKLSLTTDEEVFVQKGSFGLDDLTITGKTSSNSLEVSLKDFTLAEASSEDNPAVIYLTSAPVDLSEKEVIVRIFSSDGTIYKCVRHPSRAYEAGTWGGLKCEMEKESAIFYTSTDNIIVTPANPNAFGATITSNVYDGSRGILTFDGNVTEIGDNAFENCTTLTGIEIPETVISIGDYAFSGCTNLGADDTPASMTRMFRAPAPFRSGETSFVIPNSVTSIGKGAFQNCTSLTSITIPNGVAALGNDVFSGCKGLTSVTIPHGVTSIGDGTFAECSHLVSVTIPETVLSIGAFAFESCFDLTDVFIPIPNSITSIGPSAFMSCTSLTSFTIPSDVTAIDDFTFSSCYSLTSVSIPDGVESIGADAFSLCSSLSSITIPNSVTTIERRAFAESGLTRIFIPGNVNSIKEWAFNGCSTLTYITVHAINPPSDVTESTFANTNDCLIYVPSVNTYRTATGWSNYAYRICDHVYVDMGNGMKWATTNVGAIGPDDYGDYFTWGGTEPVTPSMNSTSSSFTDTANAIWGGSWRMPTYEEWEALLNPENYDWDFTGDGYTVTSKVSGCNGNTIFLPAAGTVGEETLMGDGWDGYYWSSAQHPDSGYGWGLLFERSYDNVYMGRYVFYGGCSVRPIYESTPNGGMEKPNYPETEINL